MPITKLDQILEAVKSKPKKRLVAAFANDVHTVEAVHEAIKLGIVDATLVGDEATILKNCAAHGIDPGQFKIVQEADEMKAANLAVSLINQGEGNLLMKGLVSSDKYMKAILNKEGGLMDKDAVLTHVTVIELPTYPKLLTVGDVAILPAPDLKQKTVILNCLIKTAQKLDIPCPKVAVIAATEQMSAGMQACVDAAILSKMAERGQIKGALVDGPLALDPAIDKESAETKGCKSPVAGDADCLLFPNIESGNVFYKFATKLAHGELGAFVAGARVPAVLSSRGDSARTKLYSIALAALTA
ncbi:MAG: phosphate butyryltransferase [Acidobacteria bacterium]|nr:phosphate butyryltransferase [Acidobacteriota bacterium]